MIILVDQITPRIQYAFEQVFRDYKGELVFTNQESEFDEYSGPKIIYSKRPKDNRSELHFGSYGILEHSDYTRIKMEPGSWVGIPTILCVKQGDLPFDIFAAVFFMLTRYEEYWRFEGDQMGRFMPENSILSQINAIERPLVDEWIRAFETYIQNKFPELIFEAPQSKFLSTIDVDSAYAYLHKGAYRTIGGILKDLSRFNFKNLVDRIKCLSGNIPDPYDTYDYIEGKHNHYGVESIFFFLLADFSEYDKGLPYTQKQFRKLILRLSKKYTVGIHPGVQSHKRYNTMLREKSRLEGITARQVTHSRQHYLMLRFRTTYRLLKSTGIKHDYSMGFAHAVGFRAGTCRPYHWFDLKKNSASLLTVHPLIAMDTTLNRYMNLSIDEAKAKVSEMIEIVKRYNGEFVSLWHNETLADINEWKGWREVFEHTLSEGAKFTQDV